MACLATRWNCFSNALSKPKSWRCSAVHLNSVIRLSLRRVCRSLAWNLCTHCYNRCTLANTLGPSANRRRRHSLKEHQGKALCITINSVFYRWNVLLIGLFCGTSLRLSKVGKPKMPNAKMSCLPPGDSHFSCVEAAERLVDCCAGIVWESVGTCGGRGGWRQVWKQERKSMMLFGTNCSEPDV